MLLFLEKNEFQELISLNQLKLPQIQNFHRRAATESRVNEFYLIIADIECFQPY